MEASTITMTLSPDFSDLTTSAAVIERWAGSGRPFEAGGVTSFVAECGDGEPVSMEPFARGEDQVAAIADRVEQIAARARDAG